tara:strand:- start:743 stop:1456 length:714 start_codon:yes stop_codon:yes gene_type:complete
MLRNKKGSSHSLFLLIIMVGLLLLLPYASYSFSKEGSPKSLVVNAGEVGNSIEEFESITNKKQALLSHCLRMSDIGVSDTFFQSYSCSQGSEVTIDSTCNFNINDEYKTLLKEQVDFCTGEKAEININENLILASIPFSAEDKGKQFELTYERNIKAQKIPILSEKDIKDLLTDLQNKKDCLTQDPTCLSPNTLAGNDLIIQSKSNPIPTVEGTNLKTRTIDFTLRYKDFQTTPLFQ